MHKFQGISHQNTAISIQGNAFENDVCKLSEILSQHQHREISDIKRTLVGNTIVDHSDVVGASPVGAAATTSSFSTYHMA